MNEEVRILSENTPQLDLLMKDPTLDGHEYFNVKTMMNDNWEKIDKFAGEAKTSIAGLEDRLNTKAEEEVVLNGGVQIVDAVRSAPFSLTGLTGRTLVNLAGRRSYRTSITNTTISVTAGSTGDNTDVINVVITNTAEGYIVYRQVGGVQYTIAAGKYYLIAADVKINSISGNGQLKVGGTNSLGAWNADKTKIGVWQRVFFPITKTASTTFDIIVGCNYAGGVYAAANFDVKNVSLYEISQSDYDSFSSLSPDQKEIKYPYVDSVTPVRNPYVIRYGENLLPPFYEWSTHANMKTIGPYSLSLNATASFQSANVYIPIVKGRAYTVSGDITGMLYMAFEDENGNVVGGGNTTSAPLPLTFTAPSNSSRLRVTVDNGNTSNGTFTFTNLMLNIGSEALPFKPREDALLALQTDLYADPVTGANADSVFEQGGQYFKAKKWNRISLDGSFFWTLPGSYTGYKVVGISGLPPASNWNALYVTKYDGKILSNNVSMTAADNAYFRNQTIKDAFDVSIPSADSGWGDNYTPTADEIKAYFLGWKMYDFQNSNGGTSTYNGAAGQTKAWCRLSSWAGTIYIDGGYTTLPTTLAKDYTPYELVYQLATPTVEPIVSEGQLTFNEGSNQVEVGTGIVLREGTKPKLSTTWNTYEINSINGGGSVAVNPLANKARKIIDVYKNGKFDVWSRSTDVNSYGLERAFLRADQYDQSAAYSVTYLMLATSPVQPITGTYAGNEKSLLEDLVDSVTQQEIRLSVVENKKAEKDSPVWAAPTLLNGATNYDTTTFTTAGFYKDSIGMVHMRGLLRMATAAVGTAIFILPVGCRPSRRLTLSTISGNGSGGFNFTRVDILPNGVVQMTQGATANDMLSLDALQPFLAEQ